MEVPALTKIFKYFSGIDETVFDGCHLKYLQTSSSDFEMKLLNMVIRIFGMAMTLIYVAVGIFVLFLNGDVVFYSTGSFADRFRYNLYHFHIYIGAALVVYGLFRLFRLFLEFKKEREKGVETED